ncbi:MAG: hypothetical protein QOI11_3684 [Candidatus Eremiobacteraeota bacterium]|jgi:protein tyrosine phosphatase (PTP) superfamily phosphohydrolase (DUF442 family)|nr:hypothetical protein [Candidatus Eremiobacteraeota bacterium]
MSCPVTATPVDFDVYAAHAAQVTYASAQRLWYVTGQPLPDAYAQIASAGIGTVISLRLPNETQPPLDPNEPSELYALNLTYSNLPIAHPMEQGLFDVMATMAALGLLFQGGDEPPLVHCSSGDRASAIFAVMLIATQLCSTADALAFARSSLFLANPDVIANVQHYSVPDRLADGARQAGAMLRG